MVIRSLTVNAAPRFLLTGPPGIGKTTVIVRLASALGPRAAGFYTVEVRDKGSRVGFKVVTLTGAVGLLAHVNLASPYRVGKYAVDPESLRPALKELTAALREENKCLLIDEIGRMELFTPGFQELVTLIFKHSLPVVATVPIKSLPFTDSLKRRTDVTLITVNRQNRDTLPEAILGHLEKYFSQR